MPLYLLLPHVLMNGRLHTKQTASFNSHRPLISPCHASLTLTHRKNHSTQQICAPHGEGLTHNDLTLRNARLPGHAQHTDTQCNGWSHNRWMDDTQRTQRKDTQRMDTQRMDTQRKDTQRMDKQRMDTQQLSNTPTVHAVLARAAASTAKYRHR